MDNQFNALIYSKIKTLAKLHRIDKKDELLISFITSKKSIIIDDLNLEISMIKKIEKQITNNKDNISKM